MCLDSKEVMFEKPEESSQHLKLLYIRGHIDGKSISRMLVDSGTAVNSMSYFILKKLGREDHELVKTNLTLNGMGGQLDGSSMCGFHGAHCREQVARYCILRHQRVR
jgi:hypothetical protein